MACTQQTNATLIGLGFPMGFNKRVRTAFTSNSWTEELTKSTVLGLVERDRDYLQYQAEREKRKRACTDAKDSIQSVFFKTEYVGNRPTLEGTYLIMDLATNSTIQATVSSCLKVCSIGERTSVALDLFNFKSYRWFRLSQPTLEDLADVRKLPLP